jgi:tetratricopeptide (TPR) repeat protein
VCDPSRADYRLSKEELGIKRVESLIERRDKLLNSCLLRQSPNNIDLWTERLQILAHDTAAYIRTFHEALLTVNPFDAEGKLSKIWVLFASFYEHSGDLDTANKIYWKAANANFKNSDETVAIWVKWTEMLLRQGAYSDALNLIQYPLTASLADKKNQLVYSNKLWSLYLDLELNFGQRETIMACYKKMIDLSVITPLNLLNFAFYLVDNNVGTGLK